MMLACFLAFGFVAKMEMRGDGVLEQMDEEVADQDVQQRALAREVHEARVLPSAIC